MAVPMVACKSRSPVRHPILVVNQSHPTSLDLDLSSETCHAESPQEQPFAQTLGYAALVLDKPFHVRHDSCPSSCPSLPIFLEVYLSPLLLPCLDFGRGGGKWLDGCTAMPTLVVCEDMEVVWWRGETHEHVVVSSNVFTESWSVSARTRLFVADGQL